MAAKNKKVSNNVNKSTSRNYLVASFVLIVIGVFIAFFYFYKSYDYAQKCQTYAEAQAIVVDHNYDSNNRIISTVIEYEVDGKKYRSTYNFKSLNIQPYGSTIKILYNPLHPDRITTIDSKISTLVLYFGGFMVLLGFTGAIIAVNKNEQDRKAAALKRYVVPKTDAELSNEYQVNEPVDSTYKQLANVINTSTINRNVKAMEIDTIVSDETEVKEVKAIDEDKEDIKEKVKDDVKKEIIETEEIKPEIEEEPELEKEKITNIEEQEEKPEAKEEILSEQIEEEKVQKEKPKKHYDNPVDALLDEYASSDDDVKKDDHFYSRKEKTKFEFASYAYNTSISDANPNEVGSFIPNIDDVEDLFIKNDDKQ